jgi:hypothetical protein
MQGTTCHTFFTNNTEVTSVCDAISVLIPLGRRNFELCVSEFHFNLVIQLYATSQFVFSTHTDIIIFITANQSNFNKTRLQMRHNFVKLDGCINFYPH